MLFHIKGTNSKSILLSTQAKPGGNAHEIKPRGQHLENSAVSLPLSFAHLYREYKSGASAMLPFPESSPPASLEVALAVRQC